MVSAEISWPTVELLVSTSEADSFTVTTSFTLPSVRVTFTVDVLIHGDRNILLDDRLESLFAHGQLVLAGSERDEGIDTGGRRYAWRA